MSSCMWSEVRVCGQKSGSVVPVAENIDFVFLLLIAVLIFEST